MSTVTRRTIERIQGDTYPERFVVMVGGTVYNVTGKTFSLVVLNASGTGEVFTASGIIDNAPTGEISFPISSQQAATAIGSYRYKAVMHDGGTDRTMAAGKWSVEAP